MKAYKVHYDTGMNVTTKIVLAKDDENFEEALSRKDPNYEMNTMWSKIISHKVIPLSSVMVTDLSITELQMFLKEN